MRSNFRYRFRAKYFWSAFLVLGVLSLTIGANRLDPLIVRALSLQDRLAKLVDYGYSESANVVVVAEAGMRTLLLDKADASAADPVRTYPNELFVALAKLADYEKQRPFMEKANRERAERAKEEAAKPKPKPSPEDPFKYVRAPKKDDKFDWSKSALNPFTWGVPPTKQADEPVAEEPPKLPELTPVIGIEWRATDPKNIVVVRSEAGEARVETVAPSGRETVAIASLKGTGNEFTGPKIHAELLKDLEATQGIGKVGSFSATIATNGLGRMMHEGMKRAVPLDDPTYRAIVNDLVKLKKDLEDESARRSVYPVGDARATPVLEAAELYLKIQGELYANYLRLAHAEDDATVKARDDKISKVKSEKANDFGGFVKDLFVNVTLGPIGPFVNPDKYEIAMNEAKKIDRTHGSGNYDPHWIDRYNLLLEPKIAIPFYKDEGIKNWAGQSIAKPFNVRHAPDGNGGFQKIELFLNAEEKRLTEYAILMAPKTKHGYLKLLQATALRERMTNRWSLRRMMGLSLKEENDRAVQACGTDLVSYRVAPGTPVRAMENYSSLWQNDRLADFELILPKILPSIAKRPLFDGVGPYSDLILTYLTRFKEFGAFFQQKFGGDAAAFIKLVDSTQGKEIQQIEEASLVAGAEEIFKNYNLQADDLSPDAIADRTAWKALEVRKQFVADSLVNLSTALGFTSLKTDQAMGVADEVVAAAVAPRAAAWRKAQTDAIRDAVKKNWNAYFVGDRNNARYAEFEKKILPLAAVGARSVQIQHAIEAKLKVIERLVTGKLRSTKPDPKTGDRSLGWKSTDRTQAAYYTGVAPSRISYVKAGLPDHLVPVTPDQLSRLFAKKLELLHDEDAPKNERNAAKRIAKSKAVSKFMQNFFADLGGQYNQAIEKMTPDPVPTEAPKTTSKVAPKMIGGTCSKTLGCGPNVSKEVVVKADGKNPQRSVEIDEKNTPLEGLLIPAARKAMADFTKAISTPPKVEPVRAKEGFVIRPNADTTGQNRFIANYGDLKSFRVQMPKLAAESTLPPRRLFIPDFMKKGEDDFYIKDEAQRKTAIGLLQEAFAMIGLSADAFDANWASGFKHNTDPGHGYQGGYSKGWDYWELSNYLSVERILRMQMGNARLLERTAGSLLDQKILANIVENEVYAKAPILAMQDSDVAVQDKKPEGRWKRFVQGTYFVPSLLRQATPYFKKDLPDGSGAVPGWPEGSSGGWNIPEVRSVFYKHIYRAAFNDLGKVEDFCEADLRDYEHDMKFKLMFKSITGLREAFASQGEAKAWDDEIAKDIRTWQERILEDYIDPISMYIMIGIILVFAWQMAPVILGFLSAAGAATTVGGVLAAAGNFLATFAHVGTLLLMGNLSPVTIMFTAQSFLMASVYCYQLPPQADYAFQVANSQIQTEHVAIASREKLQSMREEIVSSRMWARFGVAAEFLQFGLATAPGIYRSLGLKGAKVMGKFVHGVDAPLAEKLVQKSLPDLIKENGIRKGLAIYSERTAIALKGLNRVSSVSKAVTDADVAEVLVQRLAPHMDKEMLTAIYGRELGFVDGELKEAGTGILRMTEQEIAKSRTYIATLQKEAAELRTTGRWGEARSYLKNLKYKYGKDAKYFSLIVAKDYDEAAMTGKLVMNGKNAKEVQTVVEYAKLRDLEYKAAYLAEQFQELAKLAPEEITPAIAAAHLRKLSMADWQMYQKLILDVVRKPLNPATTELAPKWKRILRLAPRVGSSTDKVTEKFVKEIFKGFDYVAQDYKHVNPRMVTISRGIKNGVADLTIDKVGAENKLDPKEILANPGDYEYMTIPLDDL